MRSESSPEDPARRSDIPGVRLQRVRPAEVSAPFVRLLHRHGASPRLLRKLGEAAPAEPVLAEEGADDRELPATLDASMVLDSTRRSQALVDRLISRLDRLERDEEDPDRLAELFHLDHLATQLRRHDENRLILAGLDPTPLRREPANVYDVLRAAQSEVASYARIEFGMIDRDIEVAAHAVNDMVRLIAELFDNAATFSPPHMDVLVDARRTGDAVVLLVKDRGIGMSPAMLAKFNAELGGSPRAAVRGTGRFGFVVVALLARKHDIRVALRPADAGSGTVAEVVLPASVLEPLTASTTPGAGPSKPEYEEMTGVHAATRSTLDALAEGEGPAMQKLVSGSGQRLLEYAKVPPEWSRQMQAAAMYVLISWAVDGLKDARQKKSARALLGLGTGRTPGVDVERSKLPQRIGTSSEWKNIADQLTRSIDGRLQQVNARGAWADLLEEFDRLAAGPGDNRARPGDPD